MSKKHGDPHRGHHFWFYPGNQRLVDTRWDTHHPNHLCDNHSYCRIANYELGIVEFACNGHSTLRHGDASRNHYTYVYPPGCELLNNWDTYNIQQLCNNYTFIRKENGLDVFQCNGH